MELDDKAVTDTASSILPSSADPSQPLSASPAMGAALEEIASGAPVSMSRRNAPRPADGLNPAEILRAKVQVEAARKAEADKAATAGQAAGPRPEKRNRPVSVSSATESGKKVKGHHLAPDPNAMDVTHEKPANNRPTSSNNLFKIGRAWTAVMIGKDVNDIMGNPFANPKGWSVRISLDPGKLGQPSLGLDFKFSKDGIDSSNREHYISFAVGWEPGVRIEDKFQMENFHAEIATNPSHPDLLPFTFPAAIQKLCKRQEDAERLICVTFKSNAHKSSPMNVEWAKALEDGAGDIPYNNLKRMYSAEDPSYNVTAWFMIPPSLTLTRIHAECIQPFTEAVRDHTPPFHKYLEEDDELMTNFDPKSDLEATETEPIPILEDIDALRAENLKLKTENNSLQALMQDEKKKIEKLAEDLRQAHKERDNIVQVAEKMKHQRELKPKEIQKALNEISKISK